MILFCSENIFDLIIKTKFDKDPIIGICLMNKKFKYQKLTMYNTDARAVVFSVLKFVARKRNNIDEIYRFNLCICMKLLL